MKRLLAALLFLLAPTVAFAEACTFTTSGNWSSATAYSGTVTGCTLSADDTVTIASPAVATITGTITQTAAGEITVNSGATLTATISSALVTLTVGTNGITCASGSTCTLAGVYPTLGTSPTLASTPSTTTYWQFGDLIPCPGSDCTLARISYPSGVYNRAATVSGLDTGIDNSITALAAGDILCFWNPSGQYLFGTPDINACYPITAVSGASSPYTIDFRVRLADQQPVPNAQQDLYTNTTSGDAVVGTRTVSVPAATVGAGTEKAVVGKWIRFGAAGVYEPYGYRILSATDGGGGADTLTIASTRGFNQTYASGAQFSIDYGWRRGDPMVIYRPLKVTSATTTSGNWSPIQFAGTTNLKAVHFEKVRHVAGQGAGFSAPSELTDVFIQQADWGTNASAIFRLDDTTGQNVALRRWAMIGGDTSGGSGNTVHGMVFSSSAGVKSANVSVYDTLIRYMGDDVFVPDNYVGGTRYFSGSLTLNHVRAQWAANGGETQSFMDSSGNNGGTMNMTGNGLECLECTSAVGAVGSSLFSLSATGSTYLVSDILAYGIRGEIERGATLAQIDNIMILGGGSALIGNWMPATATNFLVRDVTITGSGVGYLQNSSTGSNVLNWRNGLVVNFAQAGTATQMAVTLPSDGAHSITNVALVNLTNNNTLSRAIHVAGSPGNYTNARIENVTVAYTPEFPTTNMIDIPFQWDPTTQTGAVIRRNAVIGARSPGATVAGLYSSPATNFTNNTDRGSWCFFDNVADVGGSLTYGSLTTDSIVDRPLNFFNALRAQFGASIGTLPAQVQCGANTTAGITRYLWAHAISGLEPENLGNLGVGRNGWLPVAF